MILIGTSGWSYPHWRDLFYPRELKPSEYLLHYCRHFSTVEVNSTFYHLPQPKTVANWLDKPPAGFTFSLKASRYITHQLKLRDCRQPVSAFLERISPLQDKTAAILWQVPPSLHRDDSLLHDFLRALPPAFKHVLEVRHQSWLDQEVFHICQEAAVCFCSISLPGFPPVAVSTAPFGYVRMHGPSTLYSSDYSEQELQEWAGRILELASKADPVLVYFNNDIGGFAVRNALRLREILSQRGLNVK